MYELAGSASKAGLPGAPENSVLLVRGLGFQFVYLLLIFFFAVFLKCLDCWVLLRILRLGLFFAPGAVHQLSAGPAASPAGKAVFGARARRQGRLSLAGPQRLMGRAGGAAPAAPALLQSGLRHARTDSGC